VIRRRPLLAFFVLAYAISWVLVALVPVSLVFALLALFGPGAGALIVTGAVDGRAGVSALLRRIVQWRVGPVPYVLAIGIPFVLAVLVQVVARAVRGTPVGIDTSGFPLTIVLAVLVIGEELGWRGFALPRLQERYSSLTASVILGVVWAAWHLANGTIPGLQHYWTGFPAFLAFVIGQTVFFTFIANLSRGSVLLAWVVHASINLSLAMFPAGETVFGWWLAGAAYLVLAVILIVLAGSDLRASSKRQSLSQPSTTA
jgi:membrane protease YdiL (CAAX protease family)